MKYDISLEQRHAVLGVLLEIWRCIHIISLFVGCIAWKRPGSWIHTITKLCKVDNPSREALVPKQVKMQKI